MKFYTVKTPKLVKRLFPKLFWEFSVTEKKIYLTFDDGPIPEITPWVLEQLALYNAKATFFCIGDNIEKHPQIFTQILSEGHSVGNHTQQHMNAWRTDNSSYFANTELCQQTIEKFSHPVKGKNEKLFRPPYGKITPKLSKKLQKSNYKIIMWDVLSGDFDTEITPEKCLSNVLEHTIPGSIIVFHDSIKAAQKLRIVLPKTLEYFSKLGYSFAAITPSYVH